MKERDRISILLPASTIGGKKGVVLRPGESLTLPVSLPKVDFPVRRHLRALGETDIFWRWRCEPGMPLLYRSIQDALDSQTAYAEKYSLHLRGKFDPWPRNAFIMLPLDGVPREKDLRFSVMVRTKDLKFADSGELSAELGIYLPKKGRHPQDVTDLPDQVLQLKLDEGTCEWRELSGTLRISHDVTAVLIRVGGTGFSGEAWIGSPRLFADGDDTLIPPFMPDNPHPAWRHFNWLGENLSRMEQPGFALRCDGREFFRGPRFNSISRNSDFEVLLPRLSGGAHKLELELLDEYGTALPFVLQGVEILQESARPVEIITYPEYVSENQPFNVLIEYNEGDKWRLDVLRVENAGSARENPSFEIQVDDSVIPIQPKRVVRYSGQEIILSTGDAIYISQDREEFLRYLIWYMEHRIGNGICIRPAYRWGGGRDVNPELWKEVVPVLEKLGIKYHLMVDGRDLPGKCSNPGDELLSGTNYLGRQAHERDGAFSYWGHISDNALKIQIFNRGAIGSELVYLNIPAPPIQQNGWISGCFDTKFAQDMKQAADLFIENVRRFKRTSTRHTGPSTLFHYFYQAGFDWLGAEQMYGPEEIVLSSLRGASKAYGRTDFGAHLAVQWSSAPHDTPQHAMRYFLSLATCYINGVSGINTEEGLWRMDADYAPFDRLSHCCEIHREVHTKFRRFVETHPRRGKMHVPLAVIQGRNCGWRCFGRGNVWGSTREEFRFGPSEESFDLLKVFYPRTVLDGIYRFPCDDSKPQGWYSGTPYGQVDLIPLAGSENSMNVYQALVFLGWNTFDENDFERILSYVEKGGRIILTRRHLSMNLERNKPSALPEKSPALACLLGDQLSATSKTVRKVGKGTVIYFPQDLYPCESSLRPDYEAELRVFGEEMIAAECRRGWIRGSEDVNFAVFDWNEGKMRTLYLLNIDHWSGRPTASAEFMFCSQKYKLELRAGTVEVITASKSVAVMPDEIDADVLSIVESEGKISVVIQSDKGAVLHVFAPEYFESPRTVRVKSGGVQEVEMSIQTARGTTIR